MRIAIAAILGLFLAANFVGCGGTTIPTPPANAQPGPPPGSALEMIKESKGGVPTNTMKGAGPPARQILK